MKRFRLDWRYVWIAAGLVALVLLVRDFNSRMAELHRLTMEYERVAATVTSMVETYEFLETRVAQATSDLLVEEIAREDLKYSKPGDYPIILLEGDESVEESGSSVVEAVQPVERWELWLALFIDSKPSGTK